MSCLESFDLIAYPGFRYQTSWTASQVNTGEKFRAKLQDALSRSGWTVESVPKVDGPNPGTGFKATSKQIPWCASEEVPEDFIGKCKIHFFPNITFITGDKQDTQFLVMNESETLKQTVSEIYLRACTGPYLKGNSADDYKYYFIGNNYQFVCFMLGAQDRNDLNISGAKTALMAGVPQIPKFLQAREGWCQYGLNECFFLWQMDPVRLGPLRKGNSFYAAGISSSHGEWLNYNQGTQNSPMLHFGIDGGEKFNTGQDLQTGIWVYNGSAGLGDPENWNGLLFPPKISWRSNPSDSDSDRMKGFLWDCVIVNKGLQADDILKMDGHNFIVFNTWAGGQSPYRPAASLLFAISGAV